MNRLEMLRRFRQKVSQAVGLRRAQTPAWPLRDGCNIPEMMHQIQSPLFRMLSAEIRISVYSDVLGDLEIFLHICLNKAKKGRSVAHWRCTDPESPFPTWQHKCFGEEPRIVEGRCHSMIPRLNTTTNDMLIALLLSCRRIYSEALIVLYERNIFHFRGGVTLPVFKRSIPAVQWTSIRHVHISTAYAPFYYPNRYIGCYKAPKTLPNWGQICEDLSSLSNLETLFFDIVADDMYFEHSRFNSADLGPLLAFLEPLKAIGCKRMEVELNMELPEEVMHRLGSVNYEITCRKRPYNENYRQLPLLTDSIELEVNR